MNRSLRIKGAIILGVILICLYGIIGIPRSWNDVVTNWNKNIHLGTDLRGGSHLVLQVQVQDAFKSEAAQVVERLKDELAKNNITVASMENTEPNSIQTADQVAVNIKGVPINKAGKLREIVSRDFPRWVLTSLSSTDYRLTITTT